MSVEEYTDFIGKELSQNVWREYALNASEYSALVKSLADSYEYFDSVTEMVMALDAGKIDRMELPQPVGEYVLRQANSSSKYVPYVFAQGVEYYLSMGFKDGSKWFEPFNAAIKAMNEDDTPTTPQGQVHRLREG